MTWSVKWVPWSVNFWVTEGRELQKAHVSGAQDPLKSDHPSPHLLSFDNHSWNTSVIDPSSLDARTGVENLSASAHVSYVAVYPEPSSREKVEQIVLKTKELEDEETSKPWLSGSTVTVKEVADAEEVQRVAAARSKR